MWLTGSGTNQDMVFVEEKGKEIGVTTMSDKVNTGVPEVGGEGSLLVAVYPEGRTAVVVVGEHVVVVNVEA